MFLIPQIEVRGTKQKGNGVFATDVIEGGTVIGDYIGIVTKPDESPMEYEDDAVYDMWYSDKVDICPDPKLPGVHLLNSSCEPNCAMAAIGRHTIIFALRKIFPEEEMTYDYFLGEQDEDCKPGTDNCQCGSELCRGTMYSNPKAYDAWDAYMEEKLKGLPEKAPVPYGETLPTLDHYPEKIQDHPIYPLFGSRTQKPQPCDMDVLHSVALIRSHIRETGKQLSFPEIGMVVEGITYNGHIVMQPMKKVAKAVSNTKTIKRKKLVTA